MARIFGFLKNRANTVTNSRATLVEPSLRTAWSDAGRGRKNR